MTNKNKAYSQIADYAFFIALTPIIHKLKARPYFGLAFSINLR